MLLTAVIFLPTVAGLLLLLLRKEQVVAVKVAGLAISLVTFILSVALYLQFDSTNAGVQFSQKAAWIPSLHISYFVGVDGMSILLVMLTTVLTPIALLSSWSS